MQQGLKIISAFSPLSGENLPEEFIVADENTINTALVNASTAFGIYSRLPASDRAGFLNAIADEINHVAEELVQRAHLESGLPIPRLMGEKDRTVNQLRLFANLLLEGSWVEAVIDTALPDRKPLPRADIRKMLVPVGPVVVFAASNFPLAFSTAGGDTASALAAGCPVIVKAHSSHLGTSAIVTGAILRAVQKTGMPEGVFASLVGEGATLGQKLALHPVVKAIGFTGSYRAGMSLYRTATTERAIPIPVYAEMSSINPVLLLPGKISADPSLLANQLAASITLGVGQFCTNPGLLFIIEDEHSGAFVESIASALRLVPAATMLNKSICASYYSNKEKIAALSGVEVVTAVSSSAKELKGSPALLAVKATAFMNEPELQEEIFGPASLVVLCHSSTEMLEAIKCLHGQLTGSVFGEEAELADFSQQIQALTEKVGRIILNQVPTGVEVTHAMVHGGPFPATTDARTTSVGTEAIKRFVRPVCWQNFPDEKLPAALQNSNPLQCMRKLNGVYTRDPIN